MPAITVAALIRRVTAPGATVRRITGPFRRRPEVLDLLFEALASETAAVRLGAAKALRILSERSPGLVYARFDSLAALLSHENGILRWNAILSLGNLARADSAGKLDGMMDQYLAPIAGHSLIDAANTMRGATAAALAKPHLAEMVAGRILEVERAVYATPECRNVAIGHALECLDRLFPLAGDTAAIREFVSRQLTNGRPATRRKAQRFAARRAPALRQARSTRG
jgi:hypothetical protein